MKTDWSNQLKILVLAYFKVLYRTIDNKIAVILAYAPLKDYNLNYDTPIQIKKFKISETLKLKNILSVYITIFIFYFFLILGLYF